MPKLYAKTTILRGEEVIPARSIFDASAKEAKELDTLGSVRLATADEIKAADVLKAEAAEG